MTCRLTLHLLKFKKQINMKKTMKIQKKSKRFPLWGCKGLLSVALSCLVVFAFAQSADICADTPYTIASTVDASGASTYQWLENGQIISGASAATYVVASNKTAGQYTYIRQAKSAECSEWQSSNEFTVTVFDCSSPSNPIGTTATFIDPRDGKQYKTVVMPDGKTWFAQNLNYTKDLTYNVYVYEANGKSLMLGGNGASAIGTYWCPAVDGSVTSGSEADCRTYGALYTWETTMMVDGKYADETKTSTAWDESWVSPNYFVGGAFGSNPKADKNNARGEEIWKDGGHGICPKGWHIPTIREWAEMLDKIDGDGNGNTFMTTPYDNQYWGIDASLKLRKPAPVGQLIPTVGEWCESPFNGSNIHRFDALPTGYNHQHHGSMFAACASSAIASCTAMNVNGVSTMLLRNTNTKAWLPVSTRSHLYAVRCMK
jgi:uncharacterized protein (TIGR02145 family)